MNHQLLSCLGVSHPSIEKVVSITREKGLHTKLTGAGGGGVVTSLITPNTDKNQVKSFCEFSSPFESFCQLVV